MRSWWSISSPKPSRLGCSPSVHRAGNLLEIIWLDLGDERRLVIHAMRLRQTFYDLLPGGEDR